VPCDLRRADQRRHLKTDPKTRKVIILESTFMPDHVKQALAKAFFDNVKVPSVAFPSASVLALAACGRSTGLVVDVGWLETTVTPVHLLHLHYDPPDFCAGYELSLS
jgi:actin-related protein 10